MSKEVIGNSIKERRKMLRITQQELANLSGVSLNTLYKIERGQANPALETIDKIAKILGLETSLVVKTITPTE
jgi:transcriptional regulator with XRE-family HTH domain